MYDRVVIHAVLLDPLTERPILVLRSEDESRILPIWIGSSEAHAIALEIEKIRVPRPMTHDLICGILESAGVEVSKVNITDLRDSTYFAEIVLCSQGREFPVDARPSDAVAVAVRTGAPIFVDRHVFEAFADSECGDEPCGEAVQRWIESLAPGDLGHYMM
jgi:uncharacterized protein